MIGVKINVLKRAPVLQQIIGKLRSKRLLLQMMGNRVRAVTYDHLLKIANTRHDTASRLGAAPSGHWGKAAEKVSTDDAVSVNEQKALLTIRHPGISRAFKDVPIKPVRAKALTIPLIAEAYNRTARRVSGLFRIGNVLAKRPDGDKHGPPQAWYKLVSSVRQRQDRSLLPSDREWEDAALQGAKDFVDLLISQQGKGGAS